MAGSPQMLVSPSAFNASIGSPNQGTASQLTQAHTIEIALSAPQHSQVSPIKPVYEVRPFPEGVQEAVVMSSGNDHSSKSLSSAFDVQDAEILRSSLNSSAVRDNRGWVDIPADKIQSRAGEGSFVEPPENQASGNHLVAIDDTDANVEMIEQISASMLR